MKMTKSAMDGNMSIKERLDKLEKEYDKFKKEFEELRKLSLKEAEESSKDSDGNVIWTSEKEKEVMCAITKLFREIGIPVSIKGYKYTRTAIMLALKDETYLEYITKKLYPTVAKTYDTIPTRVERSIRHAIECAWDRGNVSELQKIFGYTVQLGKGKPTNGEFIALIVDNFKLQMNIT